MSVLDQAKAASAAADIAKLSRQMLERRLQQLMSKPVKDHDERDKAVLALLRAELAKRQ